MTWDHLFFIVTWLAPWSWSRNIESWMTVRFQPQPCLGLAVVHYKCTLSQFLPPCRYIYSMCVDRERGRASHGANVWPRRVQYYRVEYSNHRRGGGRLCKKCRNNQTNRQSQGLKLELATSNLICNNRVMTRTLVSRPGDSNGGFTLALVSPTLKPMCKWNLLRYQDRHRRLNNKMIVKDNLWDTMRT